VAAPVFREVAMDALRMLDVPKDLPDGETLASRSSRTKPIDLSKKAGYLFRPDKHLYPPSLRRRFRRGLRLRPEHPPRTGGLF